MKRPSELSSALEKRCFPGGVSGARVSEPWDILRGRCIFKHNTTLERELEESDLTHWAPNCATFSRAREIPIRGVSNPPKPLRSELHPTGIPSEVNRMSKKSRKKLEDDTHMADLAATKCRTAHRKRKFFTLEHPARSLARHLKSWRQLLGESGVQEIFYHTCMFEGSRRKKSQVLICNSEFFLPLRLLCNGTNVCDRTGEPHLKWRPTTSGGKVVQFTTGDEREYPVGFCRAYAACAANILGSSGTFTEVFSGPNAPLSREVCTFLGESLRGARLKTDRGIQNELQRLAQITDAGAAVAGVRRSKEDKKSSRWEQPGSALTPEVLHNRLSMLEASKQPGYGKRQPLIQDGLQSESEHLKEALKLRHPFNSLRALKQDHRRALDRQPISTSELNAARLKELAEWRALSKWSTVEQLQRTHEELACKNAIRLGRKPRTALMTVLGQKYEVEDTAVPTLCLQGMPMGTALVSPFFKSFEVPAHISVKELLSTAPRRRADSIKRVKFMAKQSGHEQAEAIYKKTIKEVSQGTMGGPFTHEELIARHGAYYNVVPSFGLAQGTTESGLPKYRRIDDHTAGHTNLAAFRTQKIEMAMVDYLVVMVKALYDQFHSGIEIGTEDMQGAYRQVPLPDSQVSISITGVYNPTKDMVDLFEIYGQPFGAGHAVPNFYRVAEWAFRLVSRAYSILIDHFFDDFFYVERPACSKVSMFCLQQSFLLLGLTLDPDKSQVPAEVAQVLGVAFNTSALAGERALLVEPKPMRVANFLTMVDHIIHTNCLAPSVAASLLGKFGFLCSTLFGKVVNIPLEQPTV